MSTKWTDWYRNTRDELIQNIGTTMAFTVRGGPVWDKYILEKLRDLLDIIDSQRQNIEKLTKENQDLTTRLEKRDNEITDALTKIQNWMMKYQPILDKMDKEDEILGKVDEKDG